MKRQSFEDKKQYSESSGTVAYACKEIKMELNDYGIYEEVIKNKEIDTLPEIIEKLSQHLNSEDNESTIASDLYSDVEGIEFDDRLGYYRSLYAGYVSEGDYRMQASSGGMGTWILKELLEQGLIDGVIHVKENKSESNSRVLFKYDISRNIEEVKQGAKTKYYPVELSEVLQLVKDNPGRYAIVGIPSFIMAIRLLQKHDKIMKERITYTIGLICGHQKSSKFADSLAWQVGIKPGNLKFIDFRKKLLDQPANNYGIEMRGIVDGVEKTIIKPTKELIGHDWGQGFFKTIASDFTDDVMNETADLTLGDAWLPEYTMDSKGNNVVIVRNPIIYDLIESACDQNRLKLDKVDKETIFKSQMAHYRHTHDEMAYRLYKKDKQNMWRPVKRVKASNDIPFFRRRVQDLREEIFLKSHEAFKTAVDQEDLSLYLKEMEEVSKKYLLTYKLIGLKNRGISNILVSLKNKLLKNR